MKSLQALLGQEDRFFELFEDSAEECRRSVQSLKALLQNPADTGSLEASAASRRRDKAIHTKINEDVCSSVVTAMERDNIMGLAEALYKIPKTVEKIAERVTLAPRFLAGLDLADEMAMLEKATDTMLSMIQALRRRAALAQIKSYNDKLQAIEGDADKKVLDFLRGIYASDMEGRRVVYLKDFFELIEAVTDRCRDAGNIVVQIVLRNS